MSVETIMTKLLVKFVTLLDPNIVSMADLVVADSLDQNLIRGEIHQAVKRSLISTDDIIELGEIFAGLKPGRINADSITVADLTPELLCLAT